MKQRAFVAPLVLLFCLIPWGASTRSQQGDERLVHILDGLKKAQESIEDFSAEITQVKNSPLFKEPMTSHGRMKFKRPNKIWVEMSPPYPTITVLNKGVLVVYFPEEKVAQRYRVAGNPMMAKWLLVFQNPIETMGGRMSLLHEKEGEAVLSVDTTDELAMFKKITFWIDTALWMPKRIELVERNGDRTTIDYHHVKINTGIHDAAFELRLPTGVDIIEPMER